MQTNRTHVFAVEHPPRFNHGGVALSVLASEVDAALATKAGTPDVCLINATVNYGCTESADPDTWKANYAYIIDAVHTKWPACQIYCARMWQDDAPSQICMDYINDTLIPQVIAGRDYCHLGIDERLILPGEDNGATYTADGTHPNAAGNALIAEAWLSVLGY